MSLLTNIKDELNTTTTEKGDIAYNSTLNANLDLYAKAGQIRNSYGIDDSLLDDLFENAYEDDLITLLKNMVYIRDIRGGLGEREVFRKMLIKLASHNPIQAVIFGWEITAKYGRFDDIIDLLNYLDENKDDNNTEAKDLLLYYITNQIAIDYDDMLDEKPISLLAKWLPTKSSKKISHKKTYSLIKKYIGLSSRDYRVMVSTMRKYLDIAENHITKKEYSKIDYNKLPSKAMLKYKNLFERKDSDRFSQYIQDLKENKAKINTGALYPHDIVEKYGYSCFYNYIKDIDELLEEAWKNFTTEIKEDKNTIVVRDGSASMQGDPDLFASALSIYFSERLKGEFKDKFITFSSKPQLVDLSKQKTLRDKLITLTKYNNYYNTNLEKIYKLLYKASLNIPKEEQIDRIVIISDMQFDYAIDDEDQISVYENAKKMFEKANLKMPDVIFWNVADRNVNCTQTANAPNVALVSGSSHHIAKNIMSNDIISPLVFMLNTLEKYDEDVYEILDTYNYIIADNLNFKTIENL